MGSRDACVCVGVWVWVRFCAVWLWVLLWLSLLFPWGPCPWPRCPCFGLWWWAWSCSNREHSAKLTGEEDVSVFARIPRTCSFNDTERSRFECDLHDRGRGVSMLLQTVETRRAQGGGREHDGVRAREQAFRICGRRRASRTRRRQMRYASEEGREGCAKSGRASRECVRVI